MKSKNSTLDFSPRGYLLRYPFLVDACIQRFIDTFQDDFVQTKDRLFKMKIQLSQKQLAQILSGYLNETISSVLSKAHQGTFPAQNEWIIIADNGSDRRVSYEMIEKDIDICLKRLINVFDKFFNNLMKKHNGNQHIIYCKHRMLTIDNWIEICKKKIFGKQNIVLIDKDYNPICVKELLSNKSILNIGFAANSLIVKEATDWLLTNLQRSYC